MASHSGKEGRAPTAVGQRIGPRPPHARRYNPPPHRRWRPPSTNRHQKVKPATMEPALQGRGDTGQPHPP